MAEKLQLRSTSESAKRVKHASLKDRAPATNPIPEQLPGARAAQMVRLAMMGKIARASVVSAQQRQQQEAQSQTGVQAGNLLQQAKQGSAQQAKQLWQAQHDTAQQGGSPPTEVIWEADAHPSSADPLAQRETVSLPNSAADVQSPSGVSGAARDGTTQV